MKTANRINDYSGLKLDEKWQETFQMIETNIEVLEAAERNLSVNDEKKFIVAFAEHFLTVEMSFKTNVCKIGNMVGQLFPEYYADLICKQYKNGRGESPVKFAPRDYYRMKIEHTIKTANDIIQMIREAQSK